MLVNVSALLTILITHWFCRKLMGMLRFFLHYALVCAQPPFCKVHGSTSFQKGHKKTSSFMRTNCHVSRSYFVLPFLFPLPFLIPAFQQLDNQVLLLLLGKVLREKAVDAFTLDIEFFFLIGLFLGKNGKDDIYT